MTEMLPIPSGRFGFPCRVGVAWLKLAVCLALSGGSLAIAWQRFGRVATAAVRGSCPGTEPGRFVLDPPDFRSRNGVLQVDLTIHGQTRSDGSLRTCYLTTSGLSSPTLRVKPGDLLIVRFRNDLPRQAPLVTASTISQTAPLGRICRATPIANPCANQSMTPFASNLHFHGLTVPPACHQDDVLRTAIEPGGDPFEYRVRIPADEPPGLYWYHPHVHGQSTEQVLGGASGALIVEGIERADPMLANLPERVLVIRDLNLLNPNARPSPTEPVVPKNLVETDGDAANNGTGFGKPSKDLSINNVPVPYPDYSPANMVTRPGERELWRVLNASAITYLNLELLFHHSPQPLGIVAMDGVPISYGGGGGPAVQWVRHLGLPPGARAEFVANTPPEGVPGLLVTRSVDTGPGGENDTNRALASIIAKPDAPGQASMLPANAQPLPTPSRPWIGTRAPVRVRKFYFSEKLQNPDDPASATEFYLTEEGKTPAAFDPARDRPDIVVKQGDVEDWIIENRSMELHDFHVHQLHFELVAWNGIPVNEKFLRDTVNVPYFNGHTLQYPSVRVRMDFRDPNIVGTFVYHCHVLEHEDGGMMGVIRVEPAHVATPVASSQTEPKGVQ